MDVRASMIFGSILALLVVCQPIIGGRIGIRKLLQVKSDTDLCPLPKCRALPVSACSKPTYKVINGIRCPWCFKIVPCKEKEPTVCLTCCGPPPCCNTCGLDVQQ